MSKHPLKTILDNFQNLILKVDFQDKVSIRNCQELLNLSKTAVKGKLQQHLSAQTDRLALEYFLMAEKILQDKTSSELQDLSDMYEQIIHSL
jgi:hypothetical protein